MCASAPAFADTLTFDGNICNGGGACSNYGLIDQSYGDTAFVDVQTRYDSSGAASAANALQFWDNNYNELTNVVFGTAGSNGASVFFAPVAGYEVTLNSFNIGAYPNRDGAPSQYTIFDGLGAILYSSGEIAVGSGNLSNFYNVGLTSANGIGLLWGPEAFNVGIDNVSFTVSAIGGGAVPEPTTWAMLILGLGIVGGTLRRRKNVTLAYS